MLQPDNAIALAGMASILENVLGDVDLAEGLYERAIASSPDNMELLTNYALFVREIRKDFPRARQLMLRAIQINPKHPWLKAHAHKF